MFRSGLVSVSFRGNTTSEIIKAAAEAGLSCIEWGSDIHAKNDDTDGLKKIRKECAENGIDCCSYGTYFRIGQNDDSEILPYINAAKILGTDVLRVWCGTKSAAEYSCGEKKSLFDQCVRLDRTARRENVKLCLECHHNTFTDTADEAVRLIESVGSQNFRMYWQPNQYKTEEENIEYAGKIAFAVETVHVFNWKGDEKYPLADAAKLWIRYLSFFKDLPVLLEFMPDGKLGTLFSEAKTLKKITGELI